MRPNPHHAFAQDHSPLGDGPEIDQNLAAQVSDIAQRISRLHRIVGSDDSGVMPIVDGDMLRKMLAARKARAKFFTDGMFADPAWDILLDLLMTKLDGQRVTVSNLCLAANVPPTTALRWIKTLELDGLAYRRPDPLDGRRCFIELTKKAEAALRAYFAEIDLEFVI